MRPNQNNKNRQRGRNNNGGRKHVNPLSRNFESNGPDVKVRGNAAHVAEKYLQLARDAQSSGDPVLAENYLQHAEHYFRIVAAENGIATLSGDGRSVVFTPDPSYSGPASVQVQADDGYNKSSVLSLDVSVSDAPLLSLDFQQRKLRLAIGDVFVPVIVGQFADESNVALPPGYVNFYSTDPGVVSIAESGHVTAVDNGSAVLVVPASCMSTCCVRSASNAERSVGSASASSNAFVWSDCAPP